MEPSQIESDIASGVEVMILQQIFGAVSFT